MSELEGLNQNLAVLAASDEATVVAAYDPTEKTESAYQSEAELEAEFIKTLQDQAYEYLPIHEEADLVANLRAGLESLNDYRFSDAEWQRFFGNSIARGTDGIAEKTRRIQEDFVQVLTRDNGSSKNIKLLDKDHIHNNRLQVINQYEVTNEPGGNQANYSNRYDVTILVNGLPLVHVELKRRGVELRQAFNQINRYQRDSFWAESGLFEYVQLFVISNGTHTKYYSNTTRDKHIREVRGGKGASKKTSHSFEFTSWWADGRNRPILDLIDFTKTFFAKHTILNILTRYCVFNTDAELMVMRPYQIVATERILNRILTSSSSLGGKRLGTVAAGGYVWHTTGSGKTLTSFKAAQLASKMEGVDKVLFVVDRKDLDYQTVKEYDRFEKGAASSNRSIAILKRQLEDPKARIIITTIQKLSTLIKTNKNHPVYGAHVVIIFDECHRSQFGDMHTDIIKAFKRYHLFGFTGTPIFATNAASGGNANLKTTEQVFGDKLHTYTIVDAITDGNVLPFRIDYVNTMRVGEVADTKVSSIDTERALLDPRRVREVTAYILEHFEQKTKRGAYYRNKNGELVNGFNALFATASIEAARAYYHQFKRAQAGFEESKRLKVAMIYSFAPNAEEDAPRGLAAPTPATEPTVPTSPTKLTAPTAPGIENDPNGLLPEENFDPADLPADARVDLEAAIEDYNKMFAVNYSTSGEGFENYYKDLSARMKNREVDLTIVVNMFLTGFDATTMNTLFVDKNLRAHGLIQAFSRTNRILNSVKTYGNIVCFRDLTKETDAALELFGNKDARGIVLLRPYSEYLEEYRRLVGELREQYNLTGGMALGEEGRKAYVKLFGKILRLQNILTSFDEFAGCDPLSPRENQDYRSAYLDYWNEMRRAHDSEKASINEDVVFEIELIKQVEINVDYILMLVEKYKRKHGNGKDKELKVELDHALGASPNLRDKRDLVEAFVSSLNLAKDSQIDQAWREFVTERREVELGEIIAAEGLREAETRAFMEGAFNDRELITSGTAITRVMPPMVRFGSGVAGHDEKKRRVVAALVRFFERFNGLV